MTALIASDLDRTLIYSRRFFDTPPPLGQCVEIYEGEPISFMTEQAADHLRCLAARHLVVPTTTRTVAQYRRITLPGAPFRYAITSNGGNILVDGVPDLAWTAALAERISDCGPPLAQILAELQSRICDSWVRSVRVAEELFCYLVVDEAALPADFLTTWSQWCATHGWTVSRQGRKIYTVPAPLCKSRAVAELYGRLTASGDLPGGAPILAAGDGALDAELLGLADAAIRPAHGELHALGWHRAHVLVTANSGARAADEILAWFDDQAPTDTHPSAAHG